MNSKLTLKIKSKKHTFNYMVLGSSLKFDLTSNRCVSDAFYLVTDEIQSRCSTRDKTVGVPINPLNSFLPILFVFFFLFKFSILLTPLPAHGTHNVIHEAWKRCNKFHSSETFYVAIPILSVVCCTYTKHILCIKYGWKKTSTSYTPKKKIVFQQKGEESERRFKDK